MILVCVLTKDLIRSVTLRDEGDAEEKTLHAGDSFVIQRGITIASSSTDYGICFKCGSRLMTRL